MEAWIKFERWILGTLGVLWVVCVSYAIIDGGVPQPVPNLPSPVKVHRQPSVTQVYYEIPADKSAIPYDLDISLQIKGFKRPQGTWPGFYQKSRQEYVHVYLGRATVMPTGQVVISYDPNRVTLMHAIRERSWGSIWRRLQQNWARKKQMDAQKQAKTAFR